jgi:hypothetical protein
LSISTNSGRLNSITRPAPLPPDGPPLPVRHSRAHQRAARNRQDRRRDLVRPILRQEVHGPTRGRLGQVRWTDRSFQPVSRTGRESTSTRVPSVAERHSSPARRRGELRSPKNLQARRVRCRAWFSVLRPGRGLRARNLGLAGRPGVVYGCPWRPAAKPDIVRGAQGE